MGGQGEMVKSRCGVTRGVLDRELSTQSAGGAPFPPLPGYYVPAAAGPTPTHPPPLPQPTPLKAHWDDYRPTNRPITTPNECFASNTAGTYPGESPINIIPGELTKTPVPRITVRGSLTSSFLARVRSDHEFAHSVPLSRLLGGPRHDMSTLRSALACTTNGSLNLEKGARFRRRPHTYPNLTAPVSTHSTHSHQPQPQPQPPRSCPVTTHSTHSHQPQPQPQP